MKNLAYKIKFIFSNPVNIIFNIIKKIVSFLGTIVTLFGILDTIYKNNFHINFLLNYIYWFLLFFFVISFLLSIKWIPKINYNINGTDSYLAIKVGDICNEKGSIIISTNTSFVTLMKDDMISPKSVQGAFQNKFFKDNLSELDKLIADGLTEYHCDSSLKIKNSKKKYPVYPVGTVSKIRQNNRNVYFLGLNDINSDGQNKNRNPNDFYTAIDKLWLYIRHKGNTEEASIHLIASGRAGIKEFTKEFALKEIIKSYIGQVQNYKILTKLTIYIYPTDLKSINIKKMKKIVENQCLFAEANLKYSGKPE